MFRFGLLSKLSTSEDAKKITATFAKISKNKVDLNEAGITFFANPMVNPKITFMKDQKSRGQRDVGSGNELKVIRLPAEGETVTIDCDLSKVDSYVYGYTAKFTELAEDAVIAIVYKDLDDGKLGKAKTAIVYNPTDKNLLIAPKLESATINVEVQEQEKKPITGKNTATLEPGKYAVLTADPETGFTVKNEVPSSVPEAPEEQSKKALDDHLGEEDAEASEQAKYETIIYTYLGTAPTTFSYTIKTSDSEKTLSRFDLYPQTATIKKHTSNVIDLPNKENDDAFVAFDLEAPKFDYKKTEEEKNQVNNIKGKLTFVRVGAGEKLQITATEKAEAGGSEEEAPLPETKEEENADLSKERKALETLTYTYGYYLSLKDFDEKANVLLVRELGKIDFKQGEKIVLCNAFGKAIKLTSEQKFDVIKANNGVGEITPEKPLESLAENGFVILTLKDSETGKLTVEEVQGETSGLKTLAQEDDSSAQVKKSTNVLVTYDITAPASFIYKVNGEDKELTATDAFSKEESGESGDHEKPVEPGEQEGSGNHEKPGEPGEQEGLPGGEEKESESESTESEEKEDNKPEQEPQPEGSSDQKGDDSGNSVNVGAIVGGVIGGVAFIAIVAGLVYFFVIRKKHQPVDKESDAPKP